MSATSSPPIPDTYLKIHTTPGAGRSYHSTRSFETNTCILDISTPYAYTIYKQFRNEVCAECFAYQGGRRGFLTYREHGETAGLLFCDKQCWESWLKREGMEMVDLLKRLEVARQKKETGREKQGDHGDVNRASVTAETIGRAWDEIRQKQQSVKKLRKWSQLHLDDFEADLARYVLMAVQHLARVSSAQFQHHYHRCSPPNSESVPKAVAEHPSIPEEAYDVDMPLSFGGATWETFADLQSNEIQHVKVFPELLDNHIRVYKVLKGLFGREGVEAQHSMEELKHPKEGIPDSEGMKSPGSNASSGILHKNADLNTPRQRQCGDREGTFACKLWDVITIPNVRRALGVDPGNAFGIWEVPLTEESECLGFALYPIPSFFNHHCLPNVRKERAGRALRFVATRDICAGEELCISYGHVDGMGLEERRKSLWDGWYFQCQCSGCLMEMGK